jgi:hypothetical protein
MKRNPPVENRGPCDGGGPFAGLAKQTGFSEQFLADLAVKGELRSVIDGLTETRGARARSTGTDTPLQKLAYINAKRWPTAPKSARQVLIEVLAKRWPDWEQI